METFHIYVSGRVQGVGYRFFTYTQAKKFSIKGWVQNLENGDVEIKAQGDSENLFKFIDLLWKGPKFSSVSDVKIKNEEDSPYDSFDILN